MFHLHLYNTKSVSSHCLCLPGLCLTTEWLLRHQSGLTSCVLHKQVREQKNTNISLFSFPLGCQDKKYETDYLEYVSIWIYRTQFIILVTEMFSLWPKRLLTMVFLENTERLDYSINSMDWLSIWEKILDPKTDT